MVCYALVTLINQGSSGNQSAFKDRPFTVQTHKEELCLLLLLILLFSAYACECYDLRVMPARAPDKKRGQLHASI
jgi:hypothetical protein